MLVVAASVSGADTSPPPLKLGGTFVRLPVDPPLSGPVEFRFQRGDDPRWAAKDFDAADWPVVTGRDLPSRDGIYWLRWTLTQRRDPAVASRDGLLFKVVASYDLYWDGRLIARNGRVSATSEDEGPGSVDALFQIPSDLLEPGPHVVALRMSSWNTGFPSPTYALNWSWGNFRTMLLQRSRTALLSVMAVGAALVAAIVMGLLWLLAGRRRALLILSGLFLCVGMLQALQAWRWLFDYRYDWHYPRLVVITALTTAMAVLLPAFLLEHFNLRKRGWAYGPLAIFLTHAWVTGEFYNRISLYVCAVGFSVALGVAAGAAWRRRRGAGFAGGGMAVSVVALALAPRDFLDHAFFLSAGPALLGLLIAVVLQLREERREAQRAVLTAARLEIELLKKNIQPHFLLNTLATIQEVIEQEPRTAVTLIDALADEFRILNRVSGEKLVPLAQEVALCRAHLQVMSLRKAARCTLEVTGVEEDALVPPALFHTLIENGLTHLLPCNGRLDFQLVAERLSPGVRYRISARGHRQTNRDDTTSPTRSRRPSGWDAMSPSRIAPDGEEAGDAPSREGTGLRYIRARLEESFTGRWSLSGSPVDGGWETVIEIRDPAANGGETRAATVRSRPKEQMV